MIDIILMVPQGSDGMITIFSRTVVQSNFQ